MADPNAVFQNCFYVGNNLNAILYGAELLLYFASVSIILNGKDRSRRDNRLFLCFSTGLLAMITIYVAVQAVFGQEMWILHKDYPGGSAAYLADNAAVWYQTMGSAASVVLNLMSDGLLLYRCYIVWGDIRIIFVPCILYLATAALGILTCYISGVPDSNFFQGKAAQVALSYSSVVIGLNFLVSTLISVRIFNLSRRVNGALGEDAAKTYASAAAIIVEAAIPYTLFGLAYVVSLGLESPTSILFLSIYVMFTCISPQMIVLRVLMGRAWTREGATHTASRMQFTSAIGNLSATSGYDTELGSTTVDLRAFSNLRLGTSDNDLTASKA
ncbi:hypothetical protein C8Q76DRAFT_75058 [Earliella scabrosa]|nr:hypothetical protein C8Q76DRAFT_75058 [Earliella scabrosa]